MDELKLQDSKDWLRTNTRIEAIKGLEKLDETLTLVKDDIYQWKWAIIVLHNSIQAFMVLALQGTAQVDVLMDKTKDKRNIRNYLNHDLKNTKFKLDEFMNLYEKIKITNETQLYSCKTKFDASKEHDAAMVSINDFRNRFIHFFPCGWSLGVCGMPEAFMLLMEIIKFLINDIGNFLYKFNDGEIATMKIQIESIDRKLKELDNG